MFSLEPWLLYTCIPNVDTCMWVYARYSKSVERCSRKACLWHGPKLYTAIILGVH